MSILAPAQVELVRRYREGIGIWEAYPQVRESAALWGVSMREYIERYVAAFGPIVVTDGHTGERIDADAAWAEALGEGNG